MTGSILGDALPAQRRTAFLRKFAYVCAHPLTTTRPGHARFVAEVEALITAQGEGFHPTEDQFATLCKIEAWLLKSRKQPGWADEVQAEAEDILAAGQHLRLDPEKRLRFLDHVEAGREGDLPMGRLQDLQYLNQCARRFDDGDDQDAA